MTDLEKAETKKLVASRLSQLGETEEEIAKTLRQGNYQGLPGCAGDCPVRNYLADKLKEDENNGLLHRRGLYTSVRTGACFTHLYTNEEKYVTIANPLPVSQFVKAFDRKEYPDLIYRMAPPVPLKENKNDYSIS